VTAVVLDTGDVAAKHRRVFAGGPTITDPAHPTRLIQRLRQAHESSIPAGEAALDLLQVSRSTTRR
jgi:hypothetical protein